MGFTPERFLLLSGSSRCPTNYWFPLAEADGQMEPAEQPTSPGKSGVLYYANFAIGQPIRGPAHVTVDTAKQWAESQVQGRITWESAPLIQTLTVPNCPIGVVRLRCSQ